MNISRWLVGLLVLAGLLTSPLQSVTALSEPSPQHAAVSLTPEELESFLDEFTAEHMPELDVPGLAFVMVKDGEVFFSKGYGYADVENKVPFDPAQTIVRGGSIVKTVTALAVMQLAQEGKIDLDEDVNRYLTHFQIPDTFDKPITARQLLHYTAGLDVQMIGIRSESAGVIPPLADYLTEHLPPRVRPPGEIRVYNDLEIALAGLLVEEVSGMPYDRYVQENIFEPLGMENSSIYLPEQDARRAAVGYGSSGAYPSNYYYLNDAAGAGFNTTPADMARYMIMHLENGRLDEKEVIPATVVEELHTTRFRHHPKLPGIAYAFDEWLSGGRRILAKSGGAPGFMNRMFLLVDEGVGVYFVYNRDSNVPLTGKLYDAFMERFFPGNDPVIEPGNPAADPREMQRYTGYYMELNDTSLSGIGKVRQLMNQVHVSVNAQGRLEVFGGTPLRVDENLFQFSATGNYVAFQADEAGRIQYLFLARTAFMRLPWYESYPVQMGLLGFSLVTFISALVGWVVTGIKRRGKDYGLSGSLSLLFLGFLIGLGLLLGPAFASGEPPWALTFAPSLALLVMLALPLVGVPVTLLLTWRVVRLWKEKRSGWFVRIHNTLILVASIAFLFFLHIWNLLGYRL